MKRRLLGTVVLTLMLSLQTQADLTIRYYGKVDSVIDGDTITLTLQSSVDSNKDGKTRTLNLDGIDAPEIDQPCGMEAKEFLKGLLQGRNLLVIERGDMGKSYGVWIVIDDDKHGEGENINSLMVQKGLAWSTKVQVHAGGSDKEIQKLESEAKKEKIGIWAADSPVPPWEWRKRKEEKIEDRSHGGQGVFPENSK